MRKLIIAKVFIALLASHQNLAQTYQKLEKSLLWEISGNGLEQPSYLFGTMHAICEDDFEYFPKLAQVVTEVKSLVLEIDLSDPEVNYDMMQYSRRTDNLNLVESLEDEDIKLLNAFLLENYRTGIDKIGYLKPFVIAGMVSIKALGCDEPKSYERHLTGMAGMNELSVYGLETVADQMTIFDYIPEQDQIRELLISIKNPERDKQVFEKMISTYKAQDIEGLFAMIQEEPMLLEHQEQFIQFRNEKWVPKIERRMKREATLVAVGAGHLASEIGLIHALRKLGYEVKPVFDE